MAITVVDTSILNTMCDALVDSLDGAGNPKIKIADSGESVLCTLTFGATPSYGAAGAGANPDGVASISASLPSNTASAGGGSPGTAIAWVLFTDGADSIKFKCTGGGPGSGKDVVFSSANVETGQDVSISSLDVKVI